MFGAGFSGHGYAFASVIGEVLADLAVEDRTDHPIDLFGLDRFDARSGSSTRSAPGATHRI